MKTTNTLFGIITFTLALSVQVQAQFNYNDNGDGTCTITGYYGSDRNMTIPTNVNGLTVTSIGDYAFAEYSYSLAGLRNATVTDHFKTSQQGSNQNQPL